MCYFFLLGLFFVLILNAFFYANMHSPFLSKIYLSLFYFFNYPTTIGVFSHLMILQNIVQHIHTNENKYVAQSIIGLGICSNSTLTYIKTHFCYDQVHAVPRIEFISSLLQKFMDANPANIAVDPRKYSCHDSNPFNPITQNNELVHTNTLLHLHLSVFDILYIYLNLPTTILLS